MVPGVHQLSEAVRNATTQTESGSTIIFLEPGSHTIQIRTLNFSSNIVASVGGNGKGILSNMNIVLFPQ